MLARLGLGRTYPQIAADLGLAVNTIRSHVQRIYNAAGVHGRIQVVAWAREKGLLAPCAPGRELLGRLPGDDVRAAVAGIDLGMAATMIANRQWQAGFAAGAAAHRQAVLEKAAQLDKAAALAAVDGETCG